MNFKNNIKNVYEKERYNAVIQQRRKIAEQYNLNPDVIESIYRILMNYFIEEEIKTDPTELLETPKIGLKLPQVLSVKEIDSIISRLQKLNSEIVSDFLPIWEAFKEFAHD